jgi:hypothetical protein
MGLGGDISRVIEPASRGIRVRFAAVRSASPEMVPGDRRGGLSARGPGHADAPDAYSAGTGVEGHH